MFMRYFLTQFPATDDRTRDWLERVVLPSPTRILFRIITEDGIAVGNVGVCGISPDTAELDNLIRGEHGGDPQLIFYSELTLLNWLFEHLQVEKVTLHVFSNNVKTLNLHSSVGFLEDARLRLTKELRDGEAQYLVESDHGGAVDFRYVRMKLSAQDFRHRYPRVAMDYPTDLNQTADDVDRQFDVDRTDSARRGLADDRVRAATQEFILATLPYRYAYNFRWLGRPIIQFPQDMIAMQEIIWRVQPELIIETGIAHGGSLIYYASLLELIGKGEILGIDVDIRQHNRAAIEKHPMSKRISMIQGSAIAMDVINTVRGRAVTKSPVLVVLDSNHTHEHVLAELRSYANLVTIGSYCVVFDTVVEDLPTDLQNKRPWSVGNNPKTAVREFLREDSRFEVDLDVEAKVLITVGPGGYLKRIR